MTPILSISGLKVRFGGVEAIAGVDISVAQGSLFGLIGPNGAGKTTIMRCIIGVTRPNAGSIQLKGKDLVGLATHKRVRLGMGLSQQLVRPFRSLSVVDNVMLAAGYGKTKSPLMSLFHMGRKAERERALELIDLVGLSRVRFDFPSALPLGYLKRLEVARALALDPTVLLLDEPLSGLPSPEAAALADTIVELNARGLTIILIEHNLGEVMRICRHLVVLDNGLKIGDGEPVQVMSDPRVRMAYLGEGGGHAAA